MLSTIQFKHTTCEARHVTAYLNGYVCGSVPQETAQLPDICQNEDMPALRDGLPAISGPRVAGIFGSIIGISRRRGTNAKKNQLTPSMSMGWTMGTLACLAGVKGSLAAARATTLAGLWRPKAEAPVARMQKAAVNFIVAARLGKNGKSSRPEAVKRTRDRLHNGQSSESVDDSLISQLSPQRQP